MVRSLVVGAVSTGVLAVALGSVASAQAQDDVAAFYQGKRVQLQVGTAPGTGYDIIARALARYMPKHIPGNPSIIVQNVPGAGSIRLANGFINVGPHDGTVFGLALAGLPTAPLLTPDAAKFDAATFNWIGSTNREIQVVTVWHTAPVKTLEDLKTKELVVGATTPGTGTMDFPAISASVLGLKFRIVPGYQGTAEINVAMERGEVHGNAGIGWVSVKAQTFAWYTEGKIRIPLQFGFERHPELPNIPTAISLARTDEQRQALSLVFARQEHGRPFMAPPGVPPARVAALRRAFDATLKDPEFLAEAEKLKLEIDPMPGEILQETVAKLASTPPGVVQKVREALADAGKRQ
jgi:tripartite-type tricarboxylate transporter receptor subunit TctC